MKKEKIREYLLNNEGTLLDIVIELNSWTSYLDYLKFYENDGEFFDTYFSSPMEAVQATQSGYYSINDDYVRFNEYGILESFFDEEGKNNEIKDNIDEIVDCLIEYYGCNKYITIDDMNLKILLLNDDEEEE